MLTPLPLDLARRTYDFFTEAKYTEDGLLEALGTVEPPLPHLRNLPRLLDTTREPTLFNSLVRWFLVGIPVDLTTARRLLPDWFYQACLESGLLAVDGDALAPGALLVPCGRLLIASDLYQRLQTAGSADHVLTISPAALFLMKFTVQQPVRSTLDLGAGCGIQALAAAPHSREVVATDLNPRAAAFTAFNTRLNGFGNVRCLTGDRFEPVAGQRFDRIVCNPPFILAPSKRFLYRDNDMELDGFCRHLARQAPAHLRDGGYFQMIFEWAQIEGQPWPERVTEWFDGAGCDVWLFKNYTQAPAWYAQMRLRETPLTSREADAAEYTEWMRHYRERKVEAIHGGLVAMRLRSGANWVRIEDLSGDDTGPTGEAILRAFAARDYLEECGDASRLSGSRLRLAPDIRLDQQSLRSDGHWTTKSITLRFARGWPRTVGLEGDVVQFLSRFDGKHTVEELVQELATKAGVEPDRARGECLDVVRRMIEKGFLLPPNQTGT